MRIVIYIVLFFVPAFSFASVSFPSTNFFVDTNVFADNKTKLFVFLKNDTGEQTKETIIFKDGTETIASTTAQFKKGEYTKTVSVIWTPSKGEHSLKAIIKNDTKKLISDTHSFFIDADTDNDGIGDSVDTDDDNDGILDVDDSEPLVPYTPDYLEIIKEKIAQRKARIAKTQNNKNNNIQKDTNSTFFAEPVVQPVVSTISALENFRKNTSEKLSKIDAKQRAIKKIISKKENEGNITTEDEDTLKKAQIASALSAVGGFVFHHQTIYWVHIFILFASFFHLFWVSIKRRFRRR